ncbi:hypothetical protein [Nocardia sp. NPDC004123]
MSTDDLINTWIRIRRDSEIAEMSILLHPENSAALNCENAAQCSLYSRPQAVRTQITARQPRASGPSRASWAVTTRSR